MRNLDAILSELQEQADTTTQAKTNPSTPFPSKVGYMKICA